MEEVEVKIKRLYFSPQFENIPFRVIELIDSFIRGEISARRLEDEMRRLDWVREAAREKRMPVLSVIWKLVDEWERGLIEPYPYYKSHLIVSIHYVRRRRRIRFPIEIHIIQPHEREEPDAEQTATLGRELHMNYWCESPGWTESDFDEWVRRTGLTYTVGLVKTWGEKRFQFKTICAILDAKYGRWRRAYRVTWVLEKVLGEEKGRERWTEKEDIEIGLSEVLEWLEKFEEWKSEAGFPEWEEYE